MKLPLVIIISLIALGSKSQNPCGCYEINKKHTAIHGYSEKDTATYIKRGESKPFTGKCITLRGKDTIEQATFLNGNMMSRTQLDWKGKKLLTFALSEKFLRDSTYCEIYNYAQFQPQHYVFYQSKSGNRMRKKINLTDRYPYPYNTFDNRVYSNAEQFPADDSRLVQGKYLTAPASEGIAINPQAFYLVSTEWNYTDSLGYIHGLSYLDSSGNYFGAGSHICFSYYENCNKRQVESERQGIPFGIWKTWHKNGVVSSFINTSIEDNDTICYEAPRNHITILNLKDRSVKINRDSCESSSSSRGRYNYSPMDYANYDYLRYLASLITIHKEFNDDGVLKKEIHLKDNKRNGPYKEWYVDGTPKVIATYTDDNLTGKYTEYFADGKVKKETHYIKGIRTGTYKEYYKNGQLKWECEYADSGRSTKAKAFKPNGDKIVKTDLDYTSVSDMPPLSLTNTRYLDDIAKTSKLTSDEMQILKVAFAKDSNFAINWYQDSHFGLRIESWMWDTISVNAEFERYRNYYVLSFGYFGRRSGRVMGTGTVADLVIYKDLSYDDIDHPFYVGGYYPWYNSVYWIDFGTEEYFN